MAEGKGEVDLSRIKNKIKRRNVFQSEKLRRSKEKRERRKKRKREEEGLGGQVSALDYILETIETCPTILF